MNMTYEPQKPYNALPMLPPDAELETRALLKQATPGAALDKSLNEKSIRQFCPLKHPLEAIFDGKNRF